MHKKSPKANKSCSCWELVLQNPNYQLSFWPQVNLNNNNNNNDNNIYNNHNNQSGFYHQHKWSKPFSHVTQLDSLCVGYFIVCMYVAPWKRLKEIFVKFFWGRRKSQFVEGGKIHTPTDFILFFLATWKSCSPL